MEDGRLAVRRRDAVSVVDSCCGGRRGRCIRREEEEEEEKEDLTDVRRRRHAFIAVRRIDVRRRNVAKRLLTTAADAATPQLLPSRQRFVNVAGCHRLAADDDDAYKIRLVRFSFPFPFLFPSTYAEISNVHCDRHTSPEARLPRDEAMSDTPPSPAATDAATASSDGPSLLERCTAEAIGTSMIIGGGCGSVCAARFVPGYALGPLGVSMAFGASVALAVYMTRDVSGAHLNPAITAALAVHRPDAVSPYEAACYMGAQLTGATLAAVRDCMLSARVGGTLLRRSLWLIE